MYLLTLAHCSFLLCLMVLYRLPFFRGRKYCTPADICGFTPPLQAIKLRSFALRNRVPVLYALTLPPTASLIRISVEIEEVFRYGLSVCFRSIFVRLTEIAFFSSLSLNTLSLLRSP